MAVLKSIESARGAVKAHAGIALDLGDLRREAERLQHEARRQAEAIIVEARAERERILAGAAEEGRAKGFEQGVREGRESGQVEGHAAALAERKASLAAIEKSWGAALEELIAGREHLASETRRDAVALAAQIAERIIKRSIELDPTLVIDQVAAALDLVMRRTRLVLAVHPDDRGLVERALPALTKRFDESAHVELVADEELSPGSCVIRTEHGRIDAEIDGQIQRMSEALIGPREERAPGPGAGSETTGNGGGAP